MDELQSPSTPRPPDWRDAPRGDGRGPRPSREGWIGPGIGGVILVLLGVIFLAQNFGYPVPENWWTIFLLIPAFGAAVAAWNTYERNGRLNGEAFAALLGAATLVVIAAALIFNFAWGALWPIALIAVGAGVLLRAYWR